MDNRKDPPLVCVYPQEAWHDDVIIIGNRAGLLALQRIVSKAMETGKNKEVVFVHDGEGFDLKVILNDNPWQSDGWNGLARPYSADYTKGMAPDIRETIGPEELWQKKKLS